jgi:hypothetical protein
MCALSLCAGGWLSLVSKNNGMLIIKIWKLGGMTIIGQFQHSIYFCVYNFLNFEIIIQAQKVAKIVERFLTAITQVTSYITRVYNQNQELHGPKTMK